MRCPYAISVMSFFAAYGPVINYFISKSGAIEMVVLMPFVGIGVFRDGGLYPRIIRGTFL